MSNWQFAPDYRFVVTKNAQNTAQIVPSGNSAIETWSLRTLQNVNATLFTGNAVGELTATFYDHDHKIRDVVRPHAMNRVVLYIKNRYGQWGPAWTGYIDRAGKQFNSNLDLFQIKATSPYKLWEMKTQTPDDANNLALAYMQGITGSAVVQYSAQRVGFPLSDLIIDPNTDAGAFTWGQLPANFMVNPDQQTWSSPIQSLLADSGTEFFFDEMGRAHWRPLGYLNPPFSPINGQPLPPRALQDDEIVSADLGEGDPGVYTRVEVRYSLGGTTIGPLMGPPSWTGPATMESHLQRRNRIVYAPWIGSKQAAQYLANALGQMYAANVLSGTVTIPADPAMGVGTVIQVPSMSKNGGNGYYYIASVTYQLDWGGQWLMTLGLSYGRAPNQSFPYINGPLNYPVLTKEDQQGLPQNSQIATFQTVSKTSSQSTAPLQIQYIKSGVDGSHAITAALPDGLEFLLSTKQGGKGQVIGGSGNGHLINQYPTNPSTFPANTVQILAGTGTATSGFVTYNPNGQASDPSTKGPTQKTQVKGFIGQNPGTGSGTPPATTPAKAQPSTLSQRAMAYAYANCAGGTYYSPAAGPSMWDCAGMVAWAFNALGVSALFIPNSYGVVGATGGDVGPQGTYNYFANNHGGVTIPIAQAQPGDLIFIKESSKVYNSDGSAGYPNGQQGFAHVGWLYAPGVSFAANNYPPVSPQIGLMNVAGYVDHWGTGYNLAISMAGVTLQTAR